jgi:hypothetical protein
MMNQITKKYSMKNKHKLYKLTKYLINKLKTYEEKF